MVLEVQQAGPKYFTPDNEVPGPSSRFKRTDKDVLRIQEAKRPKIITFGEDDFPDEDDPFSSEDEKEWRDTFPTLPPARVPVPELVVNYRRVLKHLPTVPHVPISCSDGSRVYLRIFPEKTLGDVQIVPKQKTSLLGVSFQELRRRAQLSKNRFHETLAQVVDTAKLGFGANDDLWVEKYKPKSYLDLLSEETLNHSLMHWLKLWDKTVFGVDYLAKHKITKEKYAKLDAKEKEKEQFGFMKQSLIEDDEYDEMGRPKQKVALLYGPPGLGKTTCAHIVAKHAGYSVIELNASDDRSIDIFRKTLDSTTQNRTEVFRDGRPNCLIIDEIDGAPTDTVNILVDLVSGKATEKGKKKLKKVLRRPVICICNDLYAPALRTLRQCAIVLQFPSLAVSALVERMKEVSLKEDLSLDTVILHKLAEKTDCDIRSCLSSMQFMKSYKGRNADTESQDLFQQIAKKDKNKGIFAVWNDIFNLPQGKKDVGDDDPSRPASRFSSILTCVQSFGDYEKLQSGVFENYLKCKFRDSYFQAINDGLRWLHWFESLKNFVERSHNYSLYQYLPLYFVNAHFLYANKNGFKLSYPSAERITRTTKAKNVIKTQLSDMSPSVGRFLDERNMITDVVPALMTIIQPGTIRPIPTQLWNHRERETVSGIVSTMIGYNLCYVQQKQEDGTYAYSLEPNIEEVSRFDIKDTISRPHFPYTVKQLVAQEINMEKVRRHEFEIDGMSSTRQKSPGPVVETPMDIQKTEPQPQKLVLNKSKSRVAEKAVQIAVQPKDFFGRPIFKTASKIEEEKRSSGDIWYKFKEGFSNAVRKNLKLKDFL